MKPRILFFDSGLGGLSIYMHTSPLIPQAEFIYCLDNAAFPYSEKPAQVINERCRMICQQIHTQYPLDLIIIACNTASTVVLPSLRSVFSCPIVGTVPAIKPAVALSTSKHLALLATKGTVSRPYVDELIQKFAQDCKFEKFGSTLLVEMAEDKLQGKPVDMLALRKHLAPLQQIPDLDTLVQGCTHFPFLEDEFRQLLPQVKNFVNSSEAITNRVLFLLNQKGGHPHNEYSPPQRKLFATACLSQAKVEIFANLGFSKAKILLL